jgi:hypothetical protein
MRCNIKNLEGEKCDATFPKGQTRLNLRQRGGMHLAIWPLVLTLLKCRKKQFQQVGNTWSS